LVYLHTSRRLYIYLAKTVRCVATANYILAFRLRVYAYTLHVPVSGGKLMCIDAVVAYA